MISKPSTRDGYGIEQVASVHRTCLYMATKLGDLLDEIVVVGDWFHISLLTRKTCRRAWTLT
jgi:hypothetical protein